MWLNISFKTTSQLTLYFVTTLEYYLQVQGTALGIINTQDFNDALKQCINKCFFSLFVMFTEVEIHHHNKETCKSWIGWIVTVFWKCVSPAESRNTPTAGSKMFFLLFFFKACFSFTQHSSVITLLRWFEIQMRVHLLNEAQKYTSVSEDQNKTSLPPRCSIGGDHVSTKVLCHKGEKCYRTPDIRLFWIFPASFVRLIGCDGFLSNK